MKILIQIVAVLLVIFLIVPMFLGSQSVVSQDIVIEVEPEVAFSYLSDLDQFKAWNPFLAQEPDAEVKVQGKGIGATYSWKGEKVGSGAMKIIALESPNLIQFDMEFYTPFASKARVDWRLDSVDDGVKMTWTMSQDYSYLKRYFKLITPMMIIPAFNSGLEMLKTKLEEKQ